jgi:hypothetical protein
MTKTNQAFSDHRPSVPGHEQSAKRNVVELGAAARAGPGRLPRTCLAPPIDPSAEAKHWQERHALQRFCTSDFGYDDFEPAYRCGIDQFLREPFLSFAAAEPALEKRWHSLRGTSRLPWRIARFAARAAWDRAFRTAFATAHRS